MKRILYIHYGGGIGGAPLSLLYLLQQIDRTRYEPVVAVLNPGPVADLYRQEGIETHVVKGISDFSHTALEWYGGSDLWRLPAKLLRFIPAIIRTRRLIKTLRPDLVHLNSSPLAPSAIACKLEEVPLVWHIREPLAWGYLGWRRALFQAIVDWTASRVIAISHNDARQLRPGPKIHIIYNFIDFGTFDRSINGNGLKVELGIPLEASVVLMLGGIAPPKGTLILVQALSYLHRLVPEVYTVVAGPPPATLSERGFKGVIKRVLRTGAYQEAVREAVAVLPDAAQSRLIFTGIRQDVPMLLAMADCLVFPSTVPHFARPIIEAAAMAKPSVASDLGGPQELVIHGDTGLLVPPADPEALAEAIAQMLQHPDAAHQMGEAAFERAMRLFNAENNARDTIAIYNDILECVPNPLP